MNKIYAMSLNSDVLKAQSSRDRQLARINKKKKRRLAKLNKKNNVVHIHKIIFDVDPRSNAFLESYQWRRVRMEALIKHKAICQCCGASRKTGAVINVDHIKPRKLYPHLALDLNNLQVLCHECNHGKGNWDMTDWR